MSRKQRQKREAIKYRKLKPKQERERIFRQLYKDFYPESSDLAATLPIERIESNVSGRISQVLNLFKYALKGSTPMVDLDAFSTDESHTIAEWNFTGRSTNLLTLKEKSPPLTLTIKYCRLCWSISRSNHSFVT